MRLVTAPAAVLLFAIAACTATSVAGSATIPAQHPAAAWPEYNQNAARTGVASGLPKAGRLSHRWSARLDGAVYGQPLVVGGLVIAATENDSVYALNESTGRVVWRRHVGTPVPLSSLPCGIIDPVGITGTPVYDQHTGLVYAVAETTGYRHVLFGLSAGDGTVKVQRGIPAPDGHPANDLQRPALAIDAGRVYVAFGGQYGDCGQYKGSVVGIPVSGRGRPVSWHTPTSRQGAVWGTAGPVTGPGHDLWISTGNGAAGRGQAYDGSDSVTRLTPGLVRKSFFAPAVWADDNANDLDLGSTQPVLAAGNAAFIMGKRGVGYLLDATSLGGIGHQRAARPIYAAYGAAAVVGHTVYEPCGDGSGMAAIAVDAASRRIRVLWRGPSGAAGSPVVGGGAVWVTRYSDNSGTLYELNPATGAVKSQLAIGQGLPHFSSLSLAAGSAFLGTLHGVVAVSGA
jgi:outer membrane protein assembly factor BamB